MKSCYQITKEIKKASTYFVLSFSCLLLMVNPVLAQEDSSSEDEGFTLEEITVTGSRIRTTGMDTPTPVTVVVPDEVQISSPFTAIEGLAELPQFYRSNTTQSTGGFWETTGAGTLNLRGLQGKRTLQLLDGRRVVPSTIFGGPDINMFPELLVRSYETVTGGASAAYGTDAVAGTVNFLLDTEYQGVKGVIQKGETARGQNSNKKLEIAAGFALTDRTRMLFSAEQSDQDPIRGKQILSYPWYNAWGLVPNPDADAGNSPSNPALVAVPKLYSRSTSTNGILRFGDPIGWYTFDGTEAVPWVEADGDALGLCNGGFFNDMCMTTNADASAQDLTTETWTQISPQTRRENLFMYVEHDVSHKLKVYAQALRAKSKFIDSSSSGVFAPYWGGFTIYRDNAFLPEEINQMMWDNDIESVQFTRTGSYDDIAWGPSLEQQTKSLSLTTGFEYTLGGGFFDGWQLEGYIQHGKTDVKAIQNGGIRLDRIYLAIDAVIDPDTGEPACNVAVQTRLAGDPQYQDCVPLNLFGHGNASPEAVDWVTGFEPGVLMTAEGFLSDTESIPHSYISNPHKQRVIEIEQNVFEISADGEIFEGWGAGPISAAFGYHYREAEFTQVVQVGPGGNINTDPTMRPVLPTGYYPGMRAVAGGNVASGNIVEIQFSNVPHARGEQDVHEIFTEMLVPIVSDLPFVKQLNFNGAARWANYSGPGGYWSYKGGLSYEVNNSLRFRGTYSRDVRAATIGEKFDRTGGIAGNLNDIEIIDPATSEPGLIYSATRYSNGSPDIKPEKATTSTLGLVYLPGWLQGLSFSMDWYTIEVKDNINQLGASDVVEGCQVDGIQKYCDLITRGGAAEVDPNGDPITRITLVGQPYMNKDSVKAVGIDFELGYRTYVDWIGGDESISLRLLGSWVGENSETESGVFTENVKIDYPEWIANINASYQRGPFRLMWQTRYTSEMVLDEDWNYMGTSTQWDVADNTLEAEILHDAQLSYRFEAGDGNIDLFLNVNNVFDEWPQPSLRGNGSGAANNSFFGGGAGLGVSGDLRGRRYVLGMKFEF